MRKFLADLIFALHSVIVIFWWGLFFVPKSIWPDKIVFHFYLTVAVVVQQFLWGAIIYPWTKKYRMTCVLTTIMHILRGMDIRDDKIYDRYFTQEFLGKAGIKISHAATTIGTFAILAAVTVQYFFFR